MFLFMIKNYTENKTIKSSKIIIFFLTMLFYNDLKLFKMNIFKNVSEL